MRVCVYICMSKKDTALLITTVVVVVVVVLRFSKGFFMRRSPLLFVDVKSLVCGIIMSTLAQHSMVFFHEQA